MSRTGVCGNMDHHMTNGFSHTLVTTTHAATTNAKQEHQLATALQ